MIINMKFYIYLYLIYTHTISQTLLSKFNHTFGITTEVIMNKKLLSINQLNLLNQTIGYSDIIYDVQKKVFFTFKKTQYNLFKNIKVIKISDSELKILEETNNNSKKFISNNIYAFLNTIQFDLINNYKPDFKYYTLDQDEINNMNFFYHIYYRMMGVNQKYNQKVYINDWRSITMGDFLGILGNPVFIFHSGNGDELFLYLGMHECENKRIVAIMLIQFDIYGKVIKYFHHIPLCDKCHQKYKNIQLFNIVDLSNKK